MDPSIQSKDQWSRSCSLCPSRKTLLFSVLGSWKVFVTAHLCQYVAGYDLLHHLQRVTQNVVTVSASTLTSIWSQGEQVTVLIPGRVHLYVQGPLPLDLCCGQHESLLYCSHGFRVRLHGGDHTSPRAMVYVGAETWIRLGCRQTLP